MKKILLFFLVSSVVSFANDEIVSELKGLESEYESLVKEEEARFE